MNYRSANAKSEAKPSSMESYFLGIQREIIFIWGCKPKRLHEPVFNSPHECTLAVIENKISLQQAKGVFTAIHIVLSRNDLLVPFWAAQFYTVSGESEIIEFTNHIEDF